MTHRFAWEDVRELVEQHTGPARRVEPVTEGRNAEVAAIVHTDHRTVFVKGLRTDHRWIKAQEREEQVNPYVRGIAPELLWAHRGDGWHLLGFEYVSGRSIDYTPGSKDLPKLLATLRRLQQVPVPPIELKDASQRWASFTTRADRFGGDALLHTEWTPSNVLVTDDTAWLVDWAWPTRGAAWIDPACLLVWLVASGHTVPQAEHLISDLPAWAEAPTEAVIDFAHAQAAMWRGIADMDGHRWAEDLAQAAERWADYRTRQPI